MQRQLALFCVLDDFIQYCERRDAAAGEVGGVLDFDEAGGRAERPDGGDGGLDVFPGKNAAFGGHGADQAAGKDRGRRHLEVENVRARFGNYFLARLREQADGDLVAHGACGDK